MGACRAELRHIYRAHAHQNSKMNSLNDYNQKRSPLIEKYSDSDYKFQSENVNCDLKTKMDEKYAQYMKMKY